MSLDKDQFKTWHENLKEAINNKFATNSSGTIITQYIQAFPTSYQEYFATDTAVLDIEQIEKLIKEHDQNLSMSLYKLDNDPASTIRFKLFKANEPIALSDVVPMLENMGLRIISERPYIIKKTNQDVVWINDYTMYYTADKNFTLQEIDTIFTEAFYAIWQKWAENDEFNKLAIAARLNWRYIAILRAYYKYLKQAGQVFSLRYAANTLFNNINITLKIIELFECRFNPASYKIEEEQDKLRQEIYVMLESVTSLNEDQVIRCYIDMIFASIRTNYFQKNIDGTPKEYLAFKILSNKVPNLPLPRPLYEIFVYSARVEGIHLRADLVSRGGIRLSDRAEDYRTEVLGLMKTQQAKNSLIVPFGAKGGFIVKMLGTLATTEQQNQEIISCYKRFMRGLLDLTDNIKNNSLISPAAVIKYDGDDSYLVVAADKGTATFSDTANSISLEYEFWLNDAFASGGMYGYDHKKMGITAKGAWESVKEHFQSLGKDILKNEFTTVGIGDLSGDVFGNGVLLSNKMLLIAAFNHKHIFIDPNPDASVSLQERQRIFALPISSWEDYNKNLLSKGGGIYARSLKSITLSAEAQARFKLNTNKFTPNELIKAILTCEYDLLWNGGIGTFVKAKHETHVNVGDRTNDLVRVNAIDLKCTVVAEGGNLGFTQLARVEYNRNGGRINTDFIDNSAGVNCSDTEVNLKILLSLIVQAGKLTFSERNEILTTMQSAVEKLVLQNNIKQNYAISMTASLANIDLAMHSSLLKELEKKISLNREVEYLPSEEEIITRKKENYGLTRPEIAVIMSYVKILLKKELIESLLPDDEYFTSTLENYFPHPVREKFKEFIYKHKLRREIIATQISNLVVNDMGISFMYRLQDETGADSADIVKAYIITKEVFAYEAIRDQIYLKENNISHAVKMNILHDLNRLIRRGTRWFLKNKIWNLDIKQLIQSFTENVQAVHHELFTLIPDIINYELSKDEQELSELGRQIAITIPYMFSALDIVNAAITNKVSAIQVAKLYFTVGANMHLNWFREQIQQQKVHNHWDALARGAFIDDVDKQQCDITIAILLANSAAYYDEQQQVAHWMLRNKGLLKRWNTIIEDLKITNLEFTKFAVALRELLNLYQTLLHSQKLSK